MKTSNITKSSRRIWTNNPLVVKPQWHRIHVGTCSGIQTDHVSCPEISDCICFNKEGFGVKQRPWGSPGSIPRLQDTACHLRTLLNRLLYFLFPLLWPSLQVRNYGWSVFILPFIGHLKPSAGEPFSHSAIVYTRHPLLAVHQRSLLSCLGKDEDSVADRERLMQAFILKFLVLSSDRVITQWLKTLDSSEQTRNRQTKQTRHKAQNKNRSRGRKRKKRLNLHWSK